MVYLVDDDPSVRESVGRLLRLAGYRVKVFGSAAELLDRYEEGAGCVVTDVRMAGIDGFELQDRLCAAGRDVPIVFITGHGDIPMAVRAIQGGAVDFLAKPFDEKALLAAIERALASRGSSR